jgi:Protein of unknown function (DUF2798)
LSETKPIYADAPGRGAVKQRRRRRKMGFAIVRHAHGHASMDAKFRLILALLMSSVMVCMVTLLVTFLDLGLRPDFVIQWAKAYFIAWPVGAATAFFITPSARRLTDRIVALIDGRG